MLIRLPDGELVDYPDDVVALMLADPTYGDTPDLSVDEANCLIHAMIGTFFNPELTLEQNIQKVKDIYAPLASPSPSNLEKAHAQIRHYTENIALADIGYSDNDTINSVFHFQSSTKKPEDSKVIDHESDPGTTITGMISTTNNPC
jgi:hypothetical protein